jgi:hypothetical protein
MPSSLLLAACYGLRARSSPLSDLCSMTAPGLPSWSIVTPTVQRRLLLNTTNARSTYVDYAIMPYILLSG